MLLVPGTWNVAIPSWLPGTGRPSLRVWPVAEITVYSKPFGSARRARPCRFAGSSALFNGQGCGPKAHRGHESTPRNVCHLDYISLLITAECSLRKVAADRDH